jgi:phosphatidylinositol alpha-mannosyltransferase
VRVALVAEDYYPQMGGVPEHTHHLAVQLNGWGHAADVFTSHMKEEWRDAPFVHRVGTSRVIQANGGDSRITTGWGLRRRLAQLFRVGRYDVIHVQGGLAPTLGIIAPLAAGDAGIPVVATFHSWFPRSAGLRLLKRPFQRLLDRHAATIAVSQAVVDAMSRYVRVHWDVIPNGVHTGFFHPNGRRADDSLRRGPRLLFLARLERRNALETVLAALPQILERYPAAQLIVAGDGPRARRYQRQAREFGDRVRFVGQIHEQRPEFYASADLYLCPTTRASFGVTLLESMACGTPLVASDIIGFREVANGPEAVLVPPEDPQAWAQAVLDLLGDPARRESMARAGINKARRYDWAIVAQRILKVYERVLQEKPSLHG